MKKATLFILTLILCVAFSAILCFNVFATSSSSFNACEFFVNNSVVYRYPTSLYDIEYRVPLPHKFVWQDISGTTHVPVDLLPFQFTSMGSVIIDRKGYFEINIDSFGEYNIAPGKLGDYSNVVITFALANLSNSENYVIDCSLTGDFDNNLSSGEWNKVSYGKYTGFSYNLKTSSLEPSNELVNTVLSNISLHVRFRNGTVPNGGEEPFILFSTNLNYTLYTSEEDYNSGQALAGLESAIRDSANAQNEKMQQLHDETVSYLDSADPETSNEVNSFDNDVSGLVSEFEDTLSNYVAVESEIGGIVDDVMSGVADYSFPDIENELQGVDGGFGNEFLTQFDNIDYPPFVNLMIVVLVGFGVFYLVIVTRVV